MPLEPSLSVEEAYTWGQIRCRPCGRTPQDHASEAFVLSCCLVGWDSTKLSDCLLSECHPIKARSFCNNCITKVSQCGFCHASENPPMPIPLSSLFEKHNTRNSDEEPKHAEDSDGGADSDHTPEETIGTEEDDATATVIDTTVVTTTRTEQPC
jgi:hypothetical protein